MLLSSSNQGSNLKNTTRDRYVYRDSNLQMKPSIFICEHMCQTNNEMQCNIYSQIRALWFYSLESPTVLRLTFLPRVPLERATEPCWIFANEPIPCKTLTWKVLPSNCGVTESHNSSRKEKDHSLELEACLTLFVSKFHLVSRTENSKSVSEGRASQGFKSVYWVMYFIKWGIKYKKGKYRTPLEG